MANALCFRFMMMKRRQILKKLAMGAGCAATAPFYSCAKNGTSGESPWLKLAVQQYSFNRQLKSGELAMIDYPGTVVEGTGIKALEYFNGHMEEKAGDTGFFEAVRERCDDLGAANTMMLCRGKDALDSSDPSVRSAAIEGYRPWLEATKILGGQYIRVDVRSDGDPDEQKKHAADGLTALCEVAGNEFDMGIVVENHGGHSGNGKWVADLMKTVGLENCGTLPDFQNFKEYDPYLGIEEMMPWAKIVCAKSKEFDEAGNEVNVDYRRMLKIVKDSGFTGYIGIEFEGHGVDPIAGINLTKNLIETVMSELG